MISFFSFQANDNKHTYIFSQLLLNKLKLWTYFQGLLTFRFPYNFSLQFFPLCFYAKIIVFPAKYLLHHLLFHIVLQEINATKLNN